MSKKHFEAIAGIVADVREQCSDAPETEFAINEIRDQLADYFVTENPNFDRDRFVEACEND